MKHAIQFSVCFLLGIGVGWYLGYSRPVVTNQRQLLEDYEWVKEDYDVTDKDILEFLRKAPQDYEEQFWKAVINEDEMLAVVGLATFNELENGNTDAAKRLMLQRVGSYYRLYHVKGGDKDLLAKIKEAADKYPAIAAEISRKN